MTPAHLAAYIARGPSGLPAFDLPAILDALKAERAKAYAVARDAPPMPGEPTFVTFNRAIVNRLDAAIAEVEYTLNPCMNTLFEMRFAAERIAHDVLACIDHGETP